MKKTYIYILMVFVLGACTDFLDVKPEGRPSGGMYFNSDKDATDALNACYWIFSLEEVFGRNLFWEQGGADDFIFGRNRDDHQNNLANFKCTGRESSLRENWEKFNDYLGRANWVVFNLSKKSTLSIIEEKRLGEAYFMRAFCHFYLAYRHGLPSQGVPFDQYEVNHKDESVDGFTYIIPPQQASVMENYRLITEDLLKAEARLPYFKEYKPEDYGRASKDAAKGLRVKVYAYWAQHDPEKWGLIPNLVDEIEKEGNRGLLDNYADVFKIENNWSKEYIWSVSSSGPTMAGSIFPGVVLENKGWSRYNGWGYFKPTLGLFNEYKDGDKRRGVTILAYNDKFIFFGEERRFSSASDLVAGFQLAKYMEPYTYGEVVNGVGVASTISKNGDRPTTDLNLPIIRFAELVLFKAEALIMINKGVEAANELNRLTKRAGLGEPYLDASLTDLKHERRCELAGEYTDRLMDLKRWKDWSVLGAKKMGRFHYKVVNGEKVGDRDNPLAPWEPIQTWPERVFDPATDIAFPYNPDDVVKAGGKLKQNPLSKK